MDLIDIGANLTHDSFDRDREDVIARAREAGVSRMVVTGASREGSVHARELAELHPEVLFATAGVHPHHAADYDEDTDRTLRALLEDARVVAAGEAGLDYFRDFSPRDAQREAFESQLQMAIDSGKPIFLHLRDAHDDFHTILKEARPALGNIVVHCFTGDRDQLHDYLDLDCHVGITGWICDERRGTHLRDLVGRIPADRLMIETDAPYLLPRTIRPRPKSRRNEPAYLPWVLETVAECVGRPREQVAEETARTARAFFGLED